jgi:hypothetical protein
MSQNQTILEVVDERLCNRSLLDTNISLDEGTYDVIDYQVVVDNQLI